MRYQTKGNQKLGKNVVVISRPVGDTCPADCFFLNNGCYAQQTERQYANTRESARHNLKVSVSDIRELIGEAIRLGKPIRIHERGDFVKPNSQTADNPQGTLDLAYLRAWKVALRLTPVAIRPKIWVYTHFYHRAIAQLSKYGVSVYASVSDRSAYLKAKKAGFTFFAFGTSLVRGKKPAKEKVGVYIEHPIGGRTLVCPEQRMGRKHTTCDKCQWCINGRGNIVFLTH